MLTIEDDVLVSPRIVMVASGKHESFRITVNENYSFGFNAGDIPRVKLNEILSKKNSIQVVLDKISEKWLGKDYDPEGSFNKGKNTFELRIFADKTEEGLGLCDISEIDKTKDKEIEIIFKASWNVPKKGFDNYPATIKGNFNLPAKGIEWSKPGYSLISERVDAVAQPYKVFLNGKKLYESGPFSGRETGTGITVMELLKKGDNEIVAELPKPISKEMLDKNNGEFLFQVYPDFNLPEDRAIKNVAHRSLFEANFKARDLKLLNYPYSLKGKIHMDADGQSLIKKFRDSLSRRK